MEKRYPDADKRISVTTDPEHGALNELQRSKGYTKYVIPAGIGGRFSVLSPVGLLPAAVAGIDIRSLFYGAVSMCSQLSSEDENIALEYAHVRYLLGDLGYTTEVLAVFEPRLAPIGNWWQQLFGERDRKSVV